jgi:hypothetical protein
MIFIFVPPLKEPIKSTTIPLESTHSITVISLHACCPEEQDGVLLWV